LTVTRTGAGSYQVAITGLGTSNCPIPVANAFASVFMFLDGGSCGSGQVTTTLRTSDGADHSFALLAVGRGESAGAGAEGFAPAAAAPALDWTFLPETDSK
jgi:hypothetical protein